MNATATADIEFTFARGQEVAWTSTIPGLGIEIETTAVVLTVEDDHNVGEVLTVLPWGQNLAWVAWSNANLNEIGTIALEDLRLTGRTFTNDEVTAIANPARG